MIIILTLLALVLGSLTCISSITLVGTVAIVSYYVAKDPSNDVVLFSPPLMKLFLMSDVLYTGAVTLTTYLIIYLFTNVDLTSAKLSYVVVLCLVCMAVQVVVTILCANASLIVYKIRRLSFTLEKIVRLILIDGLALIVILLPVLVILNYLL